MRHVSGSTPLVSHSHCQSTSDRESARVAHDPPPRRPSHGAPVHARLKPYPLVGERPDPKVTVREQLRRTCSSTLSPLCRLGECFQGGGVDRQADPRRQAKASAGAAGGEPGAPGMELDGGYRGGADWVRAGFVRGHEKIRDV